MAAFVNSRCRLYRIEKMLGAKLYMKLHIIPTSVPIFMSLSTFARMVLYLISSYMVCTLTAVLQRFLVFDRAIHRLFISPAEYGLKPQVSCE